jgi:hypothetical protein
MSEFLYRFSEKLSVLMEWPYFGSFKSFTLGYYSIKFAELPHICGNQIWVLVPLRITFINRPNDPDIPVEITFTSQRIII